LCHARASKNYPKGVKPSEKYVLGPLSSDGSSLAYKVEITAITWSLLVDHRRILKGVEAFGD
jgi:hypothetical protein